MAGSTNDGNTRDQPEPVAHSFIVKIWVERALAENKQGQWHGHITHVPSHRREYLRRLSDIVVFIRPYLYQMGIRADLISRMKRWWKH